LAERPADAGVGGRLPWPTPLPQGAVAVVGIVEVPGAAVHPDEEALVQAATHPRRVAAFRAGRRCAALALADLGLPPAPVLRGPAGDPRWPPGVIGSVSHSGALAAAVVAPAGAAVAVGADLQVRRALRHRVLDRVVGDDEHRQLAAWPDPGVDELSVFAAKEAVVKAWRAATGTGLPLRRTGLRLAPGGRFTARPVLGGPAGLCLEGDVVAAGGYVYAVVAARR
jgi:4'-phosphopantetheinyl transferase EntD